MAEKQEANNSKSTIEAQTAELLYRLADKSYEMESARYDSLLRQSGYLLTGISIVSIALLTAVGLVADSNIESCCPTFCYVLTVLSLIGQAVALIFALCSQFRYRYKQLNPPKDLREYCDGLLASTNSDDLFSASYSSARNYADSLQAHYTSSKERNDLIRLLNKGASIALLVSILLALLDILVFVITFKVIL